MADSFNSPLFGFTRRPEKSEMEAIDQLVKDVPVAVFQALNKVLNARGFLIVIDVKEQSNG